MTKMIAPDHHQKTPKDEGRVLVEGVPAGVYWRVAYIAANHSRDAEATGKISATDHVRTLSELVRAALSGGVHRLVKRAFAGFRIVQGGKE